MSVMTDNSNYVTRQRTGSRPAFYMIHSPRKNPRMTSVKWLRPAGSYHYFRLHQAIRLPHSNIRPSIVRIIHGLPVFKKQCSANGRSTQLRSLPSFSFASRNDFGKSPLKRPVGNSPTPHRSREIQTTLVSVTTPQNPMLHFLQVGQQTVPLTRKMPHSKQRSHSRPKLQPIHRLCQKVVTSRVDRFLNITGLI